MNLDELNNCEEATAAEWFEQSCAAPSWVDAMVAKRPYEDLAQMQQMAQCAWQKTDQTNVLKAFEAHPLIGDVNSLKAKFANTQNSASAEQSGTAGADERTLQSLFECNRAYLDKHGFIFIIFATGKSAAEMLSELKQRLPNDTATEIANAAAEQLKITQLRLAKNLS